MQVRVATPDDAAAIARLAARTFILACPPDSPAQDVELHIASKLNEAQFVQDLALNTLFVADGQDGELSGYAMLVVGPPPIDSQWADPVEVQRIYVDADRHGSGLGDALMVACLAESARRNHDWVWLGTNQANERALRFYRKHGFEIVGERTFTLGATLESDYVLARPVHTVGA